MQVLVKREMIIPLSGNIRNETIVIIIINEIATMRFAFSLNRSA